VLHDQNDQEILLGGACCRRQPNRVTKTMTISEKVSIFAELNSLWGEKSKPLAPDFKKRLSNLCARYKEKGALTVLVGQELEGLLVVGKKGDLHRLYISSGHVCLDPFMILIGKPYPEWFLSTRTRVLL